MTALSVGWRALEPPRAATAVLAEHEASVALATATARRVRGGAFLRAAVSRDLLLVSGAMEDLPWAPDVIYLGGDQDVLLPTTLEPGVPIDLLVRAIRQDDGPDPTARLALLPGRALIFRLSDQPVDPEWLDRRAAGASR